MGNNWTHTSTGRDGPFIRANSSQTVEDIVRVILPFDFTQCLVVLAIECSPEFGLAEVGLVDVGQYPVSWLLE